MHHGLYLDDLSKEKKKTKTIDFSYQREIATQMYGNIFLVDIFFFFFSFFLFFGLVLGL